MEQLIVIPEVNLLGPIDRFEVERDEQTGLWDVFVHYIPTKEYGGRDWILTCTDAPQARQFENLFQQIGEQYRSKDEIDNGLI